MLFRSYYLKLIRSNLVFIFDGKCLKFLQLLNRHDDDDYGIDGDVWIFLGFFVRYCVDVKKPDSFYKRPSGLIYRLQHSIYQTGDQGLSPHQVTLPSKFLLMVSNRQVC